MIIKIWKDPVWSKVIAACILAILTFGGTYLSGAWPAIGSAIKQVWGFVQSSTTTPNWLLGAMAIPCVLFIYELLVHLRDKFVEEDQSKDFTSYTKDNFQGILWSWRFSGERIMDLCSFCPKCQYQIIPKSISAYNVVSRYEYSCDDCGYSAGSIQESPSDFEQRIKLKIQQVLRTGQWTEKI